MESRIVRSVFVAFFFFFLTAEWHSLALADDNQESLLKRVQSQDRSPTNIREIQELLRSAGFDPGPADGKLGRRTTEALQQWKEKTQASVSVDWTTAKKSKENCYLGIKANQVYRYCE